jgi:hypothetical protein
MQCVWMTLAELSVEPGDMATENTLGFMWITMWAESEQEVLKKLQTYLAKYKWTLISTEHTGIVDPSNDYGDERNKMIDETLANKNAIRLGTYHSYKSN